MDFKIKKITRFFENDTEKTLIIISEKGIDKEIVLEGNGELKETVNV